MKLAYLVNQYPQPSQSFIRREIAGIESHGVPVDRFTVRRFDAPLADARDEAERERTTSVLGAGKTMLLLNTFGALSSPGRFFRALMQTIRYGRKSERGLLVNLFYLVEAATLAKMLRAKNITHLHAHFGTNSTTVAHLQHLLGGPEFSFTCHGPEEFDKPLEINLADKISAAKFVVGISDFTRSQLFRWCEHDQWHKIHVVHCGVDSLFLSGAASPVPDVRQFVCVGRLSEQKGQLILIEAAAKLRETHREFRIVLAGDGPMRQVIEARIAQVSLGGHITLLGTTSNDKVRELILGSRAMVMPSFAEGLPVVFMEALALGRPVITTTVAGIPELVEDGKSGFLVPAGSVDRLAAAMARCLDTSIDKLTEMGAAGAQAVHSRHDAGIESKKIIALIQK